MKIRFDVFSVDEDQLDASLDTIPGITVEIEDHRPVVEVLEMAGLARYQTFALATPAIEERIAPGRQETIAFADNLLGINPSGGMHYEGQDEVTVAEFLRAADQGFYEGDAHRLVVYPWGSAGGWMPDGLPEAVAWLFASAVAGAALSEMTNRSIERVSALRHRQIRSDWRRRGLTAARLVRLLHRNSQWDAQYLAKRVGVEDNEARAMLSQSGYVESSDGLWRSSDTADAKARRATLEAIEEDAANDTP